MDNPSLSNLFFSKTNLFNKPIYLRQRFVFTGTQTVLLLALLGFGVLLLGSTVDVATINTLLLFLFISFTGLELCNRTALFLGDRRLKILGTFWIIKVLATLTLLYLGWIPQLYPDASDTWGYDPQRYYQYSWDLVQHNWDITVVVQNYQGIIIYYAVIFWVFGYNPVIPALINSFVTLLGTLFLIRCAYAFVPNRSKKDCRIAYLLLIPEVIWYDVMTARETLTATLILFSTLTVGRYFAGVARTTFTNTMLIMGVSLSAILMIRATMVIPVVLSIIVMSLILRLRCGVSLLIKVLILILSVAALYFGSIVNPLLGGYELDYLQIIDSLLSFEKNIAVEMEWSEKSIGLLLAPSNAWQSLAFVPPRMVLYLAAPFPNVAVSLSDLFAGSWFTWQRLMTSISSVLMLICFPYALAGSALAWRIRKNYPTILIIPIVFWCIFVAVVGGNIIIHERYRLMFTLLFFSCAWLGYTLCPLKDVKRWAILWFGLLFAGIIFYMAYKYS